MRLFNSDRFAEIADTITRNKSRSLLTGFGIFWGVFMLLVMNGGGQGLKVCHPDKKLLLCNADPELLFCHPEQDFLIFPDKELFFCNADKELIFCNSEQELLLCHPEQKLIRSNQEFFA